MASEWSNSLRYVAYAIDALLWLYAVILAVRHRLAARGRIHPTWVLLASYLGVWIYAPLLPSVPWAILAERKLGTLALVIPIWLFLSDYGKQLLPRSLRINDGEEPLTVLTMNIRCHNTELRSVSGLLLRVNADVLALQEVTAHHQQHLKESLSTHYPYAIHHESSGLAVYSRYPIITRKILPLEARAAVSTTFQVRRQRVRLINAHLAPVGILPLVKQLDASPVRAAAVSRLAQVQLILDAVQSSRQPVIVAGDYNMTDLTPTYTCLTMTLRDAYKERGWGLGHTFLIPRGLEIPSSLNLAAQRIDYLFHSRGLRTTGVRVIRADTGSDHYPLLGHFDLQT